MNDHRTPRIDWHTLSPLARHSLRSYYLWLRRTDGLDVSQARGEARSLAAVMISRAH